MTSEQWQRVKELFEAASELGPTERTALLARACEGDEELMCEVESLLSAHDADSGFMNTPVGSLLVGEKPMLTAGQCFGPYEEISPLGEGGMGQVYLAVDTRLRRKVALKLLPSSYTHDAERVHRFEQESRAASALNHPNIITIYEIGELDGRHFITTEFVDGKTLRELMTNARMTVSEVIDVAAQVASALQAAHEAGIVHRDIKPENIMLRSDGFVKVLDFGLAKLAAQEVTVVHAPTQIKSTVNTNPGVIMGTVGYMSPEQARGQEMDARTDIWSLGVVLFEMVTGRAPFAGKLPSYVIVSILESELPPLPHNAEAFMALERIVTKSLRNDKEERYQAVKDLGLDLKALKLRLEVEAELGRTSTPEQRRDANQAATNPVSTIAGTIQIEAAQTGDASNIHTRWNVESVAEIKQHKLGALLVLATLLLAIGGLAYFIYLQRSSRPTINSVAVLPFTNMTGDPNLEYISDGISESLINSLSQLTSIKVIGQVSTLKYKGKEVDPQEVARSLGVKAILVGRVVQRDEYLLISVALVDVQDKSHLWGKQYERKLSELITLKGDIATDVAEELRLRLSDDEQKRITKLYTNNAEAYQLYSKGRYFAAKQTEAEIRKGIEYFNQAINVDPNYALAYAGLSNAYYGLSTIYLPPSEAMPRAKAAALRALELDNNLSEAHTSLALVKTFYEWDWSGAEREYQKAIELNQNDAPAHQWYGWHLAIVGQSDQSIMELERAQELDPLSADVSWSLGVALFFARQYDKAIAQLLKTLELDPNLPLAHYHLGMSYEQKGMLNEAIAEFQKAADLMGRSRSSTFDDVAHANAVLGKRSEALKILAEVKGRSRDRVSPYGMAIIYTGLGEKDQALEWLEKAYEGRSEMMTWLKVNPRFDSLRSDARFTKLMQRVGLAP